MVQATVTRFPDLDDEDYFSDLNVLVLNYHYRR